MKDLTKSYAIWIEGLTKEKFDEFIRVFISEQWALESVIITDGKGDGGIDVKIYERSSRLKIPMQVTVNKVLYNKLEDDLHKIKNLIETHSFSNNFYFYYSRGASEIKVIDLEAKALLMGIKLDIFDNKKLSSSLELPQFNKSRAKLKDLLGDFPENSKHYFNEYDQLKFDLIAYDTDTVELKSRIVESFILFELLSYNETSVKNLIEKANTLFFDGKDEASVTRILNKFSTSKKIKIDFRNDKICLTQTESEKLKRLKEDSTFQESNFIGQLKSVLTQKSIEDRLEEIINKIIDLYNEYYVKEIHTVKGNVDENLLETAINRFEGYLSSVTKSNSEAHNLAKDIFKICQSNSYLQKISAGKFFSSLINDNFFQTYINRQPKTVYVDTSLALYFLCVLYQKTDRYSNKYYKVAEEFLNYQQTGGIKIDIVVSSVYVKEIAVHLLNAVKMARFFIDDTFSKLGPTSNVFYNFYSFLSSEDMLEQSITSFDDFLTEFGFESDSVEEEVLTRKFIETIEGYFIDSQIRVYPVHDYKYTNNKKFTELETELQKIYLAKNKSRATTSIAHDAAMLCLLFDETVEKIDPVFVTWDKSFFTIRKKYHELHNTAPYWHLYRPTQLLEHLSLMKFNLSTELLTSDIISLIDDDFDLEGKVRYLSDTLARIVDLKSKNGIKLIQGIAKIRTDYIYKIRKEDSQEVDHNSRQPIDDIVIEMSDYYSQKKGEFNTTDFRQIILEDSLLEKVLDLLKKLLENYIAKKKENEPPEYLVAIDNLTKETKLK